MRGLLSRLLASKSERGPETVLNRDSLMQVFLDDLLCRIVVKDNSGTIILQGERHVDEKSQEAGQLLAVFVENLAPEIERRIGNVQIFLDDDEISVVDSRQAKLTHFEGRALAEFGKYQLGGKPVCFSSHPFGETSAQETEKRVVAYLSEDRLTTVLFALGKLARFATFFGPAALQGVFTAEPDAEWASLSVHGNFSTLTLANAAAGTLAVRHLPIGTRNIAQAYARAHGIPEEAAVSALATRRRFGPAQMEAGDPAAYSGTHLALEPVLSGLSTEICATADYFEYQRLAGRSSTMVLQSLGTQIAGFSDWLGEMLSLKVSEQAQTLHDTRQPALNFLEGMRTGLLKVGNQRYDFAGGRFVPSKSSGVQEGGNVSSTATIARWKAASSQPVTFAALKPLLGPAIGLAMVLTLAYGAYFYMLSPSDDGAEAEALYNAGLARLGQGHLVAARATAEPVLWAKDLVAITAAMPYEMKLKRIALSGGAGSTLPSLDIVGTLPRDGDENLLLIGRFINQLSSNSALKRRFSEVNFAGAGEGDDKENDETPFHVVAKVGGVGAP